MARAMSSLPVPVGPWMMTVLSLAAISGKEERISSICGSRPTMSSNVKRRSATRRSVSSSETSRKVSTAPTTSPASLRRMAVLSRIALRSPFLPIMRAGRLIWGFWLTRVRSRAQFFSQISARKTSKQKWPMASCAVNPVMAAAARLNEVIRFSASMVKTPSLMHSRIMQHGERTRVVMSQKVVAGRSSVTGRWSCWSLIFVMLRP